MTFTAFIVLVVGCTIYFNITTKAPQSFRIDGQSEVFADQGRTIASESKSLYKNLNPSILKVAKSESLETIDLSCLKSTSQYNLTTSAQQVRLRARNCSGQSLVLKDTSMVHRESGIAATIFSLGQNRFTSDYISLADGENEIGVHAQLANGNSTIVKVIISKKIQIQDP